MICSCFSPSLPHLSRTLPGESRLHYSHIPPTSVSSSLSSSCQLRLTLAPGCASHRSPSYSALSSLAHSDPLPSIRMSHPSSAMASSSSPASSSSTSGMPKSSSLSQQKNTTTATTLYSWEELPSLFQLATSSSPPSSYLRKLPRRRDSDEDSHSVDETEPHVQNSCPCRCIYTSLMSQLASSHFSSFSSSRLPTVLQESTSTNSSPSTPASLSAPPASATTSSTSSAVSLQHSSRGEETNWEWECSVCTALQAIAKYHPAWLFESSDFYHDHQPTSPDQMATSSSCSTSSLPSCVSSSLQPDHPSCSSPHTERPSSLLSGSSPASSQPLQVSTAPSSSCSSPSPSSCGSSSFPSCSSLCTAFVCKRANSLRSCVARNALRTAACVFRSCGLHLEKRKHPCPSLYIQTNRDLLEKGQPCVTVLEESTDDEAGNRSNTGKSNEEVVLPQRRTSDDDGKKSRKGGGHEEEEEEKDFLLDEARRRRMVEMCSGLVPVLISKAGLNEKKFLAMEASEALNLLAGFIGRLEASSKGMQPSPLMLAKEGGAKWRLLPSILKHLESQQKHVRTSSPCAQFLLELVKSYLRLVVPPVESPSGAGRKESRRTSLVPDRVRVFTSSSFSSDKLSEDSLSPCYLHGSCGERKLEREENEILHHTTRTYPASASTSPSQKPRSCSTPTSDSSCSPLPSSPCTSVFLNTFSLPAACLPLLLCFSKSSQPQARQASRSALEVLAIALLFFHGRRDEPSESSATLALHHWSCEEKKKKEEKEEEGEINSKESSVSSSDTKTKEEENRNKESEDSRPSSAPLLVKEEVKNKEIKKGEAAALTTKERNVCKTMGNGCLGSPASPCLNGRETPEKIRTHQEGAGKEQREEGNLPTVTMTKVIRGSPVSLIVSLMQGLLIFSAGEKNSSFFSSSLCGSSSPSPPREREAEIATATLSHTPQGMEVGGRGSREDQEREDRRRRRQEEEDLRVLRECATSALRRTKMTADSSLSSFSRVSSVSSVSAPPRSSEGVGGMKEKKKCSIIPSERHERREQPRDDEENTRGQEDAEEKKEKKKISCAKEDEKSHQRGLSKTNELDEKDRKDFVAKKEGSVTPVTGEDEKQTANEKTRDRARRKEGEGTGRTSMEGDTSSSRDIPCDGGGEGKNERVLKEKSSLSLLASFSVTEPARLPDDNRKRERRATEERKNEDEEEEEKKQRPHSPLLLFSPRKNFGVSGEKRIKDDEEIEEYQRKTEKEETASQEDERSYSFLSLNSHSMDLTLSPEERRKKRKKDEILLPCSTTTKNSFPLSFSSSPRPSHQADAGILKASSACQEEERDTVFSGLPSSLPLHKTEKEREHEEEEEGGKVIISQKQACSSSSLASPSSPLPSVRQKKR